MCSLTRIDLFRSLRGGKGNGERGTETETENGGGGGRETGTGDRPQAGGASARMAFRTMSFTVNKLS